MSMAVLSNQRAQLEQQRLSGIRWFYWIAALSLINSILTWTGAGWAFIIGLAVTQVVDGIFQNQGPVGMGIAIAFSVGVSIFMAAIGFVGQRFKIAAIFGLVLYASDGVLCAVVGAWKEAALHGVACWFILAGLRAWWTLDKLPATVDHVDIVQAGLPRDS